MAKQADFILVTEIIRIEAAERRKAERRKNVAPAARPGKYTHFVVAERGVEAKVTH